MGKKKADDAMVHQMSKEEDSPQEQKWLSGRAFSSHGTFSSYFCLIYDSETNLKVKQALTVTAELGEDLQKLTDFTGESTQKINFPENLPKHQSSESVWESSFQAVPCCLPGVLWMQQENRTGSLQCTLPVQQIKPACVKRSPFTGTSWCCV